MSERPLPVYVDTRRVFQQEAEISGTVALGRLPRFRQGLVSDRAQVEVALAFSHNGSNQRLITGALQATVEVRCERCLEPLAIALEDDISLVLVREAAEADDLEPELDPWICADYKLDLATLVEEQLILCMPIVSFHAEEVCKQSLPYRTGPGFLEDSDSTSGHNPFSILKSLK